MSQHWGQNVSLCVSQYDWIGVKNFLTVKHPVLNSTKAIKCYLQHISKNILNYWLFFALCGDIKQTNIRELSFKVPKAMTETRSQPSYISSLHQKWLAIFETYFNNLGLFFAVFVQQNKAVWPVYCLAGRARIGGYLFCFLKENWALISM